LKVVADGNGSKRAKQRAVDQGRRRTADLVRG
jgi:hypothetical protein